VTVLAHGGELVDRIASAARAEEIARAAPTWPRIDLDARATADAIRIATGAYSPLTGFVGARDHAAIVAEGRLASGVVWPVPITLTVDEATRAALVVGGPAGLWTRAGGLLGAIVVRELFRLEDAIAVAGELELLPTALPDPAHTPRAIRAVIAARGWKRVAGLVPVGVFGRADEHLAKLALATCDGVVVLRHAVAADRVASTAARLASAEVAAAGYLPADRVAITTLPGAASTGPAGALLAALVSKNHGVGHPIVIDDGAPCLCDRYAARDLGLAPLRYAPVALCARCGELTSARTCPHDDRAPAQVDDAVLADPARLVALVRPEVVALLDRAPLGRPARAWPAPARGFILWFTGLSGAGKSTLAQAVARALRGTTPIEVLDGDEVRTHLSKGLSFTRADRDINVHRIAFVARTLAAHGIGVITAAISPFAATRAEIRALAGARNLPFVEVFANAQLAALVARDPKGLYRQALAGELAHFTGVSDPYEPPTAPEIEVATDAETIEQSTATIVAALRARGLIAGDVPTAHALRPEALS
jgi:sulfate adenylyltransferase